jgi:TMEM175 potassium channel family protein
MRPERMNAFTDGVIAILITILVLELRPPNGNHLSDILDEKGKLLAYVLSFVFVAIYWNNHHHLMQLVHRIDGRTLWANIHLLFWLSLVPIATAWLGEAGVESGPTAAYAIVLLGCALAYTLLVLSLLALHEPNSQLARAIGSDAKGRLSLALYVVSLVLAFFVPWVSIALFVTVAVVWIVPDRRVVRVLGDEPR